MSTNATFNSNDIQTANIILSAIEHESMPDYTAKLYELAHGNKSVIPYTTHPSKTIVLRGTLIDTSISALDTLIDTFKSYFKGRDKNLDIDYAGGTRRYVCTLKNSVKIQRDGGLSWAKFSVELVATEPFGKDTSNTTAVTGTGRTLGLYTDTYTFLGTAPIQYPVFTVTLTALTGGTAKTITLGNDSTGQAISITRTWEVDDVLVVNTFDNTVKVNDVEVDFSGAFPTFETGSHDISYSDDLTTRTFNYSVVYAKRYL